MSDDNTVSERRPISIGEGTSVEVLIGDLMVACAGLEDCVIGKDYGYDEYGAEFYVAGVRPMTEKEITKQRTEKSIGRCEKRIRTLSEAVKKLESVQQLVKQDDNAFAALHALLNAKMAELDREREKLSRLKKGK